MGVFVTDKDGKLKKVAGNFIPKESPNLDCLRTEVIYNASDSTKNILNGTRYSSGIVTGTTISNIDLSKYDKLFWTSCSNDTIGRYQVSNILDKSHSNSDNQWSSATLYQETPIRMGITVTNSSLTTFGTSNTRLIYLAGILKTPAMIYTGKELFAGNGIKIDNGVISTDLKNLEFVGSYSATTSMLSVEIDLSNYNYLAFVSHGRGGQGDLGVFFGQGLTWTTKLGDSSMSKAFAYCYWGYSFSSALLISYNGSKTYVQKGDSAGSAFSYATGKPSYLTVSGSNGNAEQSYITLYRSKK